MAVLGPERYIYFVVAFCARMSERDRPRKGTICYKKEGELWDKLEATDRTMMERTQDRVHRYHASVHSYTKRGECVVSAESNVGGITGTYFRILLDFCQPHWDSRLHQHVRFMSRDLVFHFNTVPLSPFLSSLNHVIIPKSPIGSCNVASACIM